MHSFYELISQKHKNDSKVIGYFELLGSTRIKAARKHVGEIDHRFVWGVRDVDDGDYLDPGDRGGLHYDKSFDVTSGESFGQFHQHFTSSFCFNILLPKNYKSKL
jgi:hypothetical protein